MRGSRVAVIVADGFEQVELDEPVKALREAGADVEILAEDEEHLSKIKGVHHFEPGEGASGDRLLSEAKPEDYDAILVPGGLASPDTMRRSDAHRKFVRAFMEAGKPTFSICHGPWVLADAEVTKGRRMTSWPAIRRDLERAGAKWEDEPVVVDGNLVTSRGPDDLPKFNDAIVEVLQNAKPSTARRKTPA